MDTRTTILKAAVEVFSRHGFRGSTTRRIAEAAAVNEVTIFRYFGSKEALLREAIHAPDSGAFSKLLPRDPVNPEKELAGWGAAMVKHLHERKSMIRKCMGEIEERPELSVRAAQTPIRATNELCAYFRRLTELGFTTADFEPTVASSMLIASLFHDAMSREMMPDIFPKPASRAPACYARFVLRAIGMTLQSEKAAPSPAETAN
ncbi:MAG: helix-turn-helix domain-containing protein [Gemmatimonadaceae bacterium]